MQSRSIQPPAVPQMCHQGPRCASKAPPRCSQEWPQTRPQRPVRAAPMARGAWRTPGGCSPHIAVRDRGWAARGGHAYLTNRPSLGFWVLKWVIYGKSRQTVAWLYFNLIATVATATLPRNRTNLFDSEGHSILLRPGWRGRAAARAPCCCQYTCVLCMPVSE